MDLCSRREDLKAEPLQLRFMFHHRITFTLSLFAFEFSEEALEHSEERFVFALTLLGCLRLGALLECWRALVLVVVVVVVGVLATAVLICGGEHHAGPLMNKAQAGFH